VSELLATARGLQGLSEATLRGNPGSDRGGSGTRWCCDASIRRPAIPEVAARRARAFETNTQFTVSRTLVADVIEKGVSTFAHDASSDARFSDGEKRPHPARAIGHVRAAADDRSVLGALYVDSLSGAGKFNEAISSCSPRSGTRRASCCTACG
jgi:hypothetical protein